MSPLQDGLSSNKILLENQTLKNENANLSKKIDILNQEMLRLQAVAEVSMKLRDATIQQIEIIDSDSESIYKLKIVAGIVTGVGVGCLAYTFAPVWMPALATKWTLLKITVLGIV